MEDFEILDLMETLEGVGQGREVYIKVNGSFVPSVPRKAYTFADDTVYTYYDTTNLIKSFSDVGYEVEVPGQKSYHSMTTNEYEYSVDFSVLFEESFSDKIRLMGKEYEYLKSGNKEFTIWGPESGIIKLRGEIEMKFPQSTVIEL
jgi:hypothetical protein